MIGSLVTMLALIFCCLLIVNQATIFVWTITYVFFSLFIIKYATIGLFEGIVFIVFLVFCLIGCITPVRKRLLSKYTLRLAKSLMPTMSNTEREALEAGNIGWEAQLFSGAPDFEQLHKFSGVKLTDAEQFFLDDAVHRLCAKINDWDITHQRIDMPPEIWEFIKNEGFLGMIIPKEYGGLGFSATAQTCVLIKLYGRSITVATTVAVPNSLGPAELLLKYGTVDQKKFYLPRLASGEEIPCFALTGPNAGSDAASIPDQGFVCYQTIDGRETLGIRLSWNKRYITLAPVATLIGLAFRLFDPDNLLGKGFDVGISCALIPANTAGVVIGRRHFPLNAAFMNGPTQGCDVFISIDCLIGGANMAGHGWRMLMECLSAGRAISLPSSALGSIQAAALGSGAYARVRTQFHQPIASFEGIEEALARIAGKTYLIDAALMMTTSAIDQGIKSGIAGAILKYHSTELAREVALDAMDIHGGKAICIGPKNYLARGYQGAPISITVEGANILTRNLIIFGQGVIRCHPYVFLEMESIRTNDLDVFDKVLWSHLSFFLANATKSLLYVFTDGRLMPKPNGKMGRYYQILRRYSANLAFIADFSMFVLGSKLKRMENTSARIGDVLSYLYIASAVLNRFYLDGEKDSEKPMVEWACQFLFYKTDEAIQDIIHNFPRRWSRVVLRLLMQPLGYLRPKPRDVLNKELAKILTTPNEMRKKLSRFVFTDALENCPLGQLEVAFHEICAVEVLEKKLDKAAHQGKLQSLTRLLQIDEARMKCILSVDEAQKLTSAELSRQQVIAVDDFSAEELTGALKHLHVKKSVVAKTLEDEKL